jgi:hypothetical protein
MDDVLVEMLVGLGYWWLPSPSAIVPLYVEQEQELLSFPEHMTSSPVL